MTRPSLERTYLHGAAEAGKVEEVACILRKSKDSVNAPDANGWTPLICAANFGHLAVCKLLLNAGADPRICTHSGTTALHYVCRLPTIVSGNHTPNSVVHLLLEKGADLNARNKSGVSALHEASYKGAESTLSYLLSLNVDVDPVDKRGETPLHYSMRSGSVMKVNKLLAYGASPFTVGEQGSPLQVAHSRFRPIFRELLKKYNYDVAAISEGSQENSDQCKVVFELQPLTKSPPKRRPSRCRSSSSVGDGDRGSPFSRRSRTKTSPAGGAGTTRSNPPSRRSRSFEYISNKHQEITINRKWSLRALNRHRRHGSMSPKSEYEKGGVERRGSDGSGSLSPKSRSSCSGTSSPPISPHSLHARTASTSSSHETKSSEDFSQKKRSSLSFIAHVRRLTKTDREQPLRNATVKQKSSDLYSRARLETVFEELLLTPPFIVVSLLLNHHYNSDSADTHLYDHIINFFHINDVFTHLLRVQFTKCLEHEVSKDHTTLFRSTDVSLVLCSKYFARVGQEFLKNVISPIIDHVSTLPKLEVNPKRIRGEKREQKVEENAEKLIHTAELLWQSLAANINTCPFQILDTIQMVTKLAFFKESKLPGTSQGVHQLVVSNLFFLRFFCSALCSPHQYGIVSEPLDSNVSRSMILLTKLLQNLATGVVFGEKEDYMRRFNCFIIEHANEFEDLVSNFLNPTVPALRPQNNIYGIAAQESMMFIRDYFLSAPHIWRDLSEDPLTVQKFEEIVMFGLSELFPLTKDH